MRRIGRCAFCLEVAPRILWSGFCAVQNGFGCQDKSICKGNFAADSEKTCVEGIRRDFFASIHTVVVYEGC